MAAISHPSRSPLFDAVLTPDEATSSEIEALQRSHDFTRIAPTIVLVLAVGTFALPDVAFEDWLCGMIILVSSVIPLHIWARRKVVGMPIWPVVALMWFAVYGVPFFVHHPLTDQYSVSEKVTASGTIAGVIMVVTFIWSSIGAARPTRPLFARVVPLGESTRFFLACIAAACAFQLNLIFSVVNISSELFGVLRAVFFSLCTISIFSLSYDLGRGLLSTPQRVTFIALIILYAMSNMVTLYLYSAMQITFLALLGYSLGGGKPPWRAIVALALVFSVLQAGKNNIRGTYWAGDDPPVNTVSGMVTLFEDWFSEGTRSLLSPVSTETGGDSLFQRASLTHLVLKTETESPSPVPFLEGSTYLAIPELLIPRFIWPERPPTQETLRQLSVHYGLLTIEDTESTTIGWGLISESFANFGTFGCIGLAVVLGCLVGTLQRMCGRFPVKSARGLFALLVVFCMINVEATASSLSATLAQSTFALVILIFVTMREQRIVA